MRFLLPRLLLAFSVIGLAAPDPASGQFGPFAFGFRNLAFGSLLPGVPESVSPADGSRSGRFVVFGLRRAEVRIDFSLPAALAGAGGENLALQFGPTDGGFSTTPAAASMVVFDPRVPLVTRLGNTGLLYLWLGGTALPSGQQRAGNYSATITITVAYTGS
ncbi:MAG: hypothetical protein KatS3mg081_1648 [Gemmatimonadales bacterium]|nr:MAG: hypothetical protein KatS3mg081_1648 [Gemmatimonadales bacterium]